MRSYRAARRAVTEDPVKFEVTHVDADGVDQAETFTCTGEVSALLLSELAYNADLDVGTPGGMALLRQVFAEAFGDEAEYQRFFRLRSKIRMPDEQLMEIMGGLIEDFAGRPTSRPSDSPGTPSVTTESGQDSKVVSLDGYNIAATPLMVVTAGQPSLSESAVQTVDNFEDLASSG